MNALPASALIGCKRVPDSGQRPRWDHLPGPVLDKHSTGGVGERLHHMAMEAGCAIGGQSADLVPLLQWHAPVERAA